MHKYVFKVLQNHHAGGACHIPRSRPANGKGKCRLTKGERRGRSGNRGGGFIGFERVVDASATGHLGHGALLV